LPGVTVQTPDGTTWTVRRRWIPHRDGKGIVQRFRNHRTVGGLEDLDLPIGFGLDAAGFVIGIVLFVTLGLLLVFGWPLLLLGIDLAWLLIVGILGLVGRVVLGRPWRVESVSDTRRHDWYVQGFRAAGRLRDDLANQYRHGHNPLPPATTQMPH
jgi:hypothetical protein